MGFNETNEKQPKVMLNWIKENENLAFLIFAGFTMFIVILFCVVIYKGMMKSMNDHTKLIDKIYNNGKGTL